MFKILSVCKGGGYRYCRTDPPHPRRNSNGLYPLHRVLLENFLGRLLGRDEHAHHIDGNKANDSIENLECLTAAEHTRRHQRERRPKVEVMCRCGNQFQLPAWVYRRKLKRNNGTMSCSFACGVKFRKRRD